MTRSTHSKSRKPRNQKQISQKRGTRKLQRGGAAWYDYLLPSFLKSNKVDPSLAESQSRANDVHKKALELAKAMEGLELCSKQVKQNTAEPDAQRQEQDRQQLEEERLKEEEKRKEDERLKQAAPNEPMGGGMGSRGNRRGRGRGPRAPPKKSSKKGPRKDIIF